MPAYEYECQECRRQFNLVMSVGQHEKEKVHCPNCKSENVKQLIEPIFVTTSRKS